MTTTGTVDGDGSARILVIDDEETTRRFLSQEMVEWGLVVDTADSGEQGIERMAAATYDLALVDLAMPGLTGFQVLEWLAGRDHAPAAVVMTGYGSIESAVRAMKAGAADYLTKPFEVDHLQLVVQKTLRGRRREEKLQLLEEQLEQQASFESLVGVSPPMQRIYGLIRQLADNDTTVLIQGETGTGKELVARAIHRRSARSDQAFVPINCGALPETILESELFGHERGAFTGAVRRKFGLIEQAAHGTLFLDEIEATSEALQVKLLRAIQEREVLRVGGDGPIPVDFRLVAAANTDLRQQMEQGRFRADIYYRLSVVVVDLPPLRARREDVPLLAKHFLARFARKGNRPAREFSAESLMLLQAYSWPGNVRELENAVEQAVFLCDEPRIRVVDLPERVSGATSDDIAGWPAGLAPEYTALPLRQARERFEREYLDQLLQLSGGVVSEAARRAGIRRQHLHRKLNQFGLRGRPR